MSFVDIADGAWSAGILFRNYIVLNDAVTFRCKLRLQLAPSRGCSNVRREYYREKEAFLVCGESNESKESQRSLESASDRIAKVWKTALDDLRAINVVL